MIDILPALKDGDSHFWTLMPERKTEDIPSRIHVSVAI